MNQYRYPGAQPFTIDQKDIFFGREQDIQKLLEQISLQRLIVLYAKSGLGKSSLLNAGIIPKIREAGEFEPLSLRFGAWTANSTHTPTSTARERIREMSSGPSFLDKLIPAEDSLWYHVKNFQINNRKKRGFILIFDQFEELFSYPNKDILAFQIQLAELLNRQIPQRFRKVLETQFQKGAPALTDAELDLLHTSFDLKVVLAIRSDRMSLLDKLTDHLPLILRNNYELGPLNEEQAEDAILRPAYKNDSNFLSPPFDFEDDAIEAILRFLTKEHTQKIESFQLQILCQSIERTILENQLTHLRLEDMGNIPDIYKNYYDNQIARLGSPEEQLAARRLIEEGLIFEEEERRLSLYEGQIYRTYDVSPELLRRLVSSHLLRAEISIQGGFTYELCHDTLVGPILQAKERRQSKEEKIRQGRELEEARRMAEEERRRKVEMEEALKEAQEQRRKARLQRRRARIFAVFAILLGASSFLGFINASNQKQRALQQEKIALQQKEIAEQKSKALVTKEIQELLQKAQNYLDAKECTFAERALTKAAEEAAEIDLTDVELNAYWKELEVCKANYQ